MTLARPTIAITVGEPAGIGPEIALRAAWALRHQVRSVLIGDCAYIAMLAHDIDPSIAIMGLSIEALRNYGLPQSSVDKLLVLDVPLAQHVQIGQLDARNGRAVVACLDVAMEAIKNAWCQAMVTAPVQKSTINQAGVAFTGHTEYLAQHSNTEQVVMMLACQANAHLSAPLRVALATTHLALKDVPSAITFESLLKTITIIHHDLQSKFGIAQPRILVAGLNPHAGENGYLGREEIEVITPAIQAAQALGLQVSGPYPADTLFQTKYLQDADCVLAMYHDQGLPVLKHASFGQGVNITLGLPFIRTSVDHGTALDIAQQGLGIADFGSMQVALQVACDMVLAQQKQF